MAKISNIFKEETRKADLHPKRVTHWIHYTKLKDNPAQYRYGKTVQEREELLKQGIVNHKEIKAYKKSKDVPKSGTMELPLLQFETEQEWKDFLLQYPSWKVVNKNKMTEEILYEYRLVNGTKILVREFPYTSGEETISCQEWYLWRPEIRHFRNARVSLEDVIDYMRNENE